MSTPTDERRVEYMPLSTIRRAPRNPKNHDGPAIRASLTRFGVADLPVLDERTGQLVSGHGRLDQAEDLYAAGDAPPGGVRVDPTSGEWLLPVARGWASRTDEEAEAYLVTANSLTMFGGWDEQGLAELLGDLAETDAELLALTKFSPDDLDRLLAAQTVPDLDSFKSYDDDEPSGESGDSAEVTCPGCGLEFSP